MLKLNDNVTKRLALELLIQKLDGGEEDTLSHSGVSPALLDALRERPVRDLIRVAEMIRTEIHIAFDSDAILNCFQRLDSIKRHQALRDYFVRHGASSDMLASLFKLSQGEIRERRERLCAASPSRGRPAGPTLEEREDIWQAWLQIGQAETDKRECYYQLHQRFSHLAPAVLWTVVHEAGRASRCPRLPSQQSFTSPMPRPA